MSIDINISLAIEPVVAYILVSLLFTGAMVGIRTIKMKFVKTSNISEQIQD